MSEETAEPTLLGLGTWTRQGPATLVVRENAWMMLSYWITLSRYRVFSHFESNPVSI